ncbi:MAG: hypothetical protein ACRC8S_23220 [Fimbriiglobus sp.]
MKLLASVALFSVALFLTGCSDSKPNATPVTTSDMLSDLSELLKEYAKTSKGAPKKLSDLQALEPNFPAAYHALTNNKCVYMWGNEISTGQNIIAYETEVPTAGGSVLLQDGTVKKMTPDEFKSAPKAAKK